MGQIELTGDTPKCGQWKTTVCNWAQVSRFAGKLSSKRRPKSGQPKQKSLHFCAAQFGHSIWSSFSAKLEAKMPPTFRFQKDFQLQISISQIPAPKLWPANLVLQPVAEHALLCVLHSLNLETVQNTLSPKRQSQSQSYSKPADQLPAKNTQRLAQKLA